MLLHVPSGCILVAPSFVHDTLQWTSGVGDEYEPALRSWPVASAGLILGCCAPEVAEVVGSERFLREIGLAPRGAP